LKLFNPEDDKLKTRPRSLTANGSKKWWTCTEFCLLGAAISAAVIVDSKSQLQLFRRSALWYPGNWNLPNSLTNSTAVHVQLSTARLLVPPVKPSTVVSRAFRLLAHRPSWCTLPEDAKCSIFPVW